MNLSVAAAALVFLFNPTAQWAGDKVVDYKIEELLELPEVSSAGYDSWVRLQDEQDVLRVKGFYMDHQMVNLQTQTIDVPLFHDWLRIGSARAEIPGRDMVWSFSQLQADFASERNGQILAAMVDGLTYQGAPFEFAQVNDPLVADLYQLVADQFAVGELGSMEVRLLDRGAFLELHIGWQQESVFKLDFTVRADISYRAFQRDGYEAERWSESVSQPVQVHMRRGSKEGLARDFGISWSARPEVFEPLIELVLREVPRTLESLKG